MGDGVTECVRVGKCEEGCGEDGEKVLGWECGSKWQRWWGGDVCVCV